MKFWAFVFWASVLAAAPLAAQERLLRVMGEEYPRVFFFRMAEGLASNPKVSYEDWEKNFSRLMGIMGKVLDEEVPGRSARNIEFFTRFKKAHPDQVVLMHYNGNSRDPRWEAQRFFAGHWVYFKARPSPATCPPRRAKATST